MSEAQDVDPLVSFDCTAFESPSTAVVTAVAAASGVDPVSIDPLYEVIDPDALNSIVASASGGFDSSCARIEFTYQDYRVLVKANGQGHLYEPNNRSLSAADSPEVEVTKQMN